MVTWEEYQKMLDEEDHQMRRDWYHTRPISSYYLDPYAEETWWHDGLTRLRDEQVIVSSARPKKFRQLWEYVPDHFRAAMQVYIDYQYMYREGVEGISDYRSRKAAEMGISQVLLSYRNARGIEYMERLGEAYEKRYETIKQIEDATREYATNQSQIRCDPEEWVKVIRPYIRTGAQRQVSLMYDLPIGTVRLRIRSIASRHPMIAALESMRSFQHKRNRTE